MIPLNLQTLVKSETDSDVDPEKLKTLVSGTDNDFPFKSDVR